MKHVLTVIFIFFSLSRSFCQTTIHITGPTTNTPGQNNTMLGVAVGPITAGADNVFMGYQSGYNNISGHSNVFLGWKAGHSNTSGRANVFIGRYAGSANVEGSDNTFVGYNAGILSTGY